MKPVPNLILAVLLLALCGLCGWQWNRESQLRTLAAAQQAQIASLTALREELESRVKAADAEVLRITGSLADLRANSVSKQTYEEALQANATLKEVVEKQNAAIARQNDLLARQNTAMMQANDHIKKLTGERDDLGRRLNEVTALYNKLVKPKNEASQ
jgi:predicted nuclease with TOPRIM domain